MTSTASGWVDTSRSGPPPSEVHIDTAVARALLATLPATGATQGLADAPLTERCDGWDMAVFHVGKDHALRLPRTAPAVTSLSTELNGLTTLGAAWTFPHTRIVHVGEPTPEFPWPWAVTTWLEGDTADFHPLSADAGAGLGAALAEVHQQAGADAPFNLEQSISMAERAAGFEWALPIAAGRIGPGGERLDDAAAQALWDAALAAPEPSERVWSHADCHGSNLLSHNGAFAGMIDWGKMAGCDRAVDLGFLYTVLPAAGVDAAVAAYRAATNVTDTGLEARAKGIAVAKAASWATLDREANVVMAWRAFAALGVLAVRQ